MRRATLSSSWFDPVLDRSPTLYLVGEGSLEVWWTCISRVVSVLVVEVVGTSVTGVLM